VEVELGWPHRPLAVELAFRGFVDQREPAAPRALLSDLLAAAARGEDDQGIALSAPPRTRFRLSLLDTCLPWHRLGRRGVSFLSAAWLEASLRSAIPDFRERLRARRFAEPVRVELELGDGRCIYTPVALWGQDAPAEAQVEIGDRLVVRLRDVPEPWLAQNPEGEPEAWFLIADHDTPWTPAERRHAELHLERATALVTAPVPDLRRYSVRTRARGWPPRFGIHVADGARLDATQAFTTQLARILADAGARVAASTLVRCFQDAPHGAGAWKALDHALDALRERPFPPAEAADWLAGEVGEEPYLASPLPALLARAAPSLVMRTALEAVASGRVAADAAAAWLQQLRLVPWMISREAVSRWPRTHQALTSVVEALVAAPARDVISDGWFRLLLLHALAKTGSAAEAIGQCVSLLQAAGLPISKLMGESPPWPTVSVAVELKELTSMPAADRPYAQIWYRCQLAGRGDRALPEPRFPRRPSEKDAPPHLCREPHSRATLLAASLRALARATAARGDRRPSAAEHAAVEDALGVGAAWFATCLLQHDLRGSR
jgi:hypothetical protein